jgi:hypothetical protein
MRPRDLWGFALCATLWTACATGHGSRVAKIKDSAIVPGERDPFGQIVPKITDSAIVPGEPDPFGEIVPVPGPTVGIPEQEVASEPLSSEDQAQESLSDRGARISTKEALAEALTWTTEGLQQYESGDIEAAHKSLVDARLMFSEAALPDELKTKGLGFFRPFLPGDLQQYDPDEIAERLDRTDRPSTAELIERPLVEKEVRSLLSQFGYSSPEDRYAEALIRETQQYIQFFRDHRRKFVERSLLRKYKYWPMIQKVFAEKNVPLDFGYVALVESGFQPQALSKANAVGLWQFIPETGNQYGLRSPEDFYDARQSTGAAAAYLLKLSSIFGSRLLALAAYNAGEWKIIGCLGRLDDPKKRSFWEIRGCLKKETREYVAKVLAVAVIGNDPQRFGFDLPTEEEMRRRYDVVMVSRVTSLEYLASLAGVKVAYLRENNSELAPTATKTPCRNFPLYVPSGTGAPVTAALASAPEERPPSIAPLGSIEMAQPVSEPRHRHRG